MDTYTVTLTINLDREEGYDPPQNWDWTTLLDMAPGGVEMVKCVSWDAGGRMNHHD